MKNNEREQIRSSDDVIRVLRKVWSSQLEVKEEFVVLHLDNSNRVLGYQLLSKGGINSTIVDVRLIYSTALQALASNIIIAHNHPSGNTRPSGADVKITSQIKKVGEFHNINLLDSVILTKDDHLSFADEGLL